MTVSLDRNVAASAVAPTETPRKMVTMLHEFVLRRLGETLGHAADIEQVAQHQEADQRRCVGNEQGNQKR